MNNESNSVDIVILTFNDGDLINKAVSSALSSEGITIHIWIVNNGSDSVDQFDLNPKIDVVNNSRNVGVGAGRNQGIALGCAEFVCVLDSDATLTPTSLINLLEPLRNSSIGMSVPCFSNQDPSESAGQIPTLKVKLQRALGLRNTYESMNLPSSHSWWDVDFGIGACQLFRRAIYDQVGGIDESDHFGPEDLEFCDRVRQAGYQIVQVRGAEVYHPPRREHRKIFTAKGVRHLRALIRYYWRKHWTQRQMM